MVWRLLTNTNRYFYIGNFTNMIDCSDDAILWVIDLSDLWYWKWSINKLKVVHKQTRYSLLRPSISCLTFQVPQADHGSVVSQRGLGDFSGRRFGRLPWHLEVSPEMGDSKRHQTYGCFIGKMMTGWWFEPRWKMSSSVGMIILPTEWKNPNHQPDDELWGFEVPKVKHIYDLNLELL